MDGTLRVGSLISFFVAALAAGASGFATGIAVGSSEAVNNSIPKDLYTYTYDGEPCVFGNKKDPITVVFTHDGFPDVIKQQAIDHGDWEVQAGPQYFGDQQGCHPSDGSPASNCCSYTDRWHMRHYNHRGPEPDEEVRVEATFGSISSASPHHDDAEDPFFGHPDCRRPPPLVAHSVYDNSVKYTIAGEWVHGGFNAGREDIRKNWVVNGGHELEATFWWDNTADIEQCDHGLAGSDGRVYYIHTYGPSDSDADGCLDSSEDRPKSQASIGGGRDPDDPWDYYDVSVPKDGFIDLSNDILGVVLHYQPALGANPYYDRGGVIGPNHWNRAGPDGTIDLSNDILGVILQYGHDCH